jgi:Glycosyltransferase 61
MLHLVLLTLVVLLCRIGSGHRLSVTLNRHHTGNGSDTTRTGNRHNHTIVTATREYDDMNDGTAGKPERPPSFIPNLVNLETYGEPIHNWLWYPPLLSSPNMSYWFNISTINDSMLNELKETVSIQGISPRLFYVPMAEGITASKEASVHALVRQLASGNLTAYTLYDRINSTADNLILGKIYRELYDRDAYDIDASSSHPLPRRRLATFQNVHVNQYGTIVQMNGSTVNIVRNGGCTYMPHGKLYEFKGEAMNFTSPSAPVISLGAGASGTYHYPMELLVALAGIDEEVVNRSHILIPERSRYTLGWLNVINVTSARVIDKGHVFAETLLVPEMGRCGWTFRDQILWLAHKAQLKLDEHREMLALKRAEENRNISMFTNYTTDSRPVLVLLERSVTSRGSPNRVHVRRVVNSFANNAGYRVVIHGERGRFPSILNQIALFSNASIMISTHGAGQVFINFLPRHACVLDFSASSDPWWIYARYAYLRSVSYMVFFSKGAHDRNVSIPHLEQGLANCGAVVKEHYTGASPAQPFLV